ncbi:MAG TPA: ATP-binding protein, partial [Aggregatilineaceae bacterium]|nr:ATP-binding protein [Aggregatilineaceae bacterium]
IFETFEPRPSLPENEQQNLQNAFQTAVAYAKSPQGWLVFLGKNGCGKTHLAAAIANYRQHRGDSVILMTVPDLLDYLRAAFSGGTAISLDKRFRELETVSLLILDQLDLRNATPWALEKIRQLADHRYLSRLPTLFTTTQPIEDIDPMLQSRLLDKRSCRLIAILAPDYRGGDSAGQPKRQGRSRRSFLD